MFSATLVVISLTALAGAGARIPSIPAHSAHRLSIKPLSMPKLTARKQASSEKPTGCG